MDQPTETPPEGTATRVRRRRLVILDKSLNPYTVAMWILALAAPFIFANYLKSDGDVGTSGEAVPSTEAVAPTSPTLAPATTLPTVDSSAPTSSDPTEGPDSVARTPTITPRELGEGKVFTVGGSVRTGTAYATDSNGKPSVTVSPVSVCTKRGAYIKFVGPGTCSVTVNVSGTSEYRAWKRTLSATVLAKADFAQKLTTQIGTSRRVGFSTIFETSHDGMSNGLNVEIGSPDVCSYADSKFAFFEVGTCKGKVVIPATGAFGDLSENFSVEVTEQPLSEDQLKKWNEESTTTLNAGKTLKWTYGARHIIMRPSGDFNKVWRFRVSVKMKSGTTCSQLTVGYRRGTVQTDSSASGDDRSCRDRPADQEWEECLQVQPSKWRSADPGPSLPDDRFEEVSYSFMNWNVFWSPKDADNSLAPSVRVLEAVPGKCPT